MKRTTLLILFCILFFVSFSKDKHAAAVEQLRQTELAFSKLCVEKGMAISFVFYADKDVVKLSDKQFPVISKDSLIAAFPAAEKETFTLEWYPFKVEVAKSLDFGYTVGNWILTSANGKKRYGNYMTVWKKQKDGTWKFVLDGGNTTPEPTK